MNPILITGAHGKLGHEIVKKFPGVIAPTHKDFDITNKARVFEIIEQHKPGMIIHLAADTNVRRCEEHREEAYKINVGGTENLISACEKFVPSARFIYMSTACVFHGDRGNYSENDVPYPKNFYALTKLLGEFVVKKLENYLIIRGNFVAKEKWPYEKAFNDRFGTYLFAEDLSRGIKDVIDQKMTGIVHVVGEEKLSMLDLARILTPEVKPMTMAEVDLPLTIDMSLRSVRIKPYKISR